MSAILPTHHCFDDALDFLALRLRERAEDAAVLRIVHAVCLAPPGPREGERYAHAWVEDDRDGLVWDAGVLDGLHVWFAVRREEYYREKRVTSERTAYSAREALALNEASGHFGPWEERYRALCSSDRRILGAVEATGGEGRC